MVKASEASSSLAPLPPQTLPAPEQGVANGGLVLIGEYLRIARRRWVLIAGCMSATIAVAVLLTLRATPQYTSTAALFVSTSERETTDAYQGSLFSQQRVASYAELTNRRELARRAIARLGLDMEPGTLVGKLDARAIPETVILEISVVDPSPQKAQQLTQAAALEVTEFVSELETPEGKDRAPIKASIIDPASLSTTPVSPQPTRNLGIAAVLGLIMGLGLAVLRELFDTSVKTQEDVVAVTGAAVMGTISLDPVAAKKPLVTDLSSQAPRVEAFRVLRTNLQFVNVDSSSKVFVVTSSMPAEGKTTTAINLAITLAQASQRVLLVEGDLRRPKISKFLSLETSVGLTTALVGRAGLESAVQESPVKDLSVLTSGAIPPNPSELLQSQAMADLLAKLRTMYDVIIVDAPPLLPVTDAALLTAQSDGALLVVRHGKTTRDQLRHAVERLEAVDARALGVVFNMIPPDRQAPVYSDGYGYRHEPESQREQEGKL